MVLYGATHMVGDNITTDQIIDPALGDAGDPAELAAFCLAAVDSTLAERVGQGDILLAGAGFGAGAQPEPAALALLALGFAAVICAGADSSFVAVAHGCGLPVLVCPPATALGAGRGLRLDLSRGVIADRAGGATFSVAPSPPELLDLLRRTQLHAHARRVVEEEGFDG